MARHDRRPEEGSHVDDVRVADLILERDQRDGRATGIREVHASVTNGVQRAPSALRLVGPIEIIPADHEVPSGEAGGDRVAVVVVACRAIRPPRDLLVDRPSPAALAVCVLGRQRIFARPQATGQVNAGVTVGECSWRTGRPEGRCDVRFDRRERDVNRLAMRPRRSERGEREPNQGCGRQDRRETGKAHGYTIIAGGTPRVFLARDARFGYIIEPPMTDGPHAFPSLLAALFDAERTARKIHAQLARVGANEKGSADLDALVAALRKEADAARVLKDDEESALRFVRIAALLGDLHGADVVDLLIDVLAEGDPEARHAAGEALEGLAYDRFKEVALGIERALVRLPIGSPALSELPYMLAEIPEPGAVKLLGRFLQHADPEAVAAAIEALVEVGDPTVAAMLAPLEHDKRVAQLEDDEGEEGKITIGELAAEARTLLAEIDGARPGETRTR